MASARKGPGTGEVLGAYITNPLSGLLQLEGSEHGRSQGSRRLRGYIPSFYRWSELSPLVRRLKRALQTLLATVPVGGGGSSSLLRRGHRGTRGSSNHVKPRHVHRYSQGCRFVNVLTHAHGMSQVSQPHHTACDRRS